MRMSVVVRGVLSLLLLGGCVGTPDGIEAVRNFEVDRYLGTWYEIARLDHSFERGLTDVTATYTLRDDGGLDVVNRGFDPAKGEWEEADGPAYFVGDRDVGRLKVSFFGPFYGGYNVIGLDREEYRWALVCGPKRSYLWILARDPELPEPVYKRLVAEAKRLGFPVDQLIRVHHTRDGG